MTPISGAPVVALAPDNALLVLEVLGLARADRPDSYTHGSVPAEEFSQRLAGAALPVATPADPDLAEALDYLDRRLADLAEIAAVAREAGGNVAWM